MSKLYLHFEDSVIKIKCGGGGKHSSCAQDEDECADFKMGTLIDLNFVEFEAKEIHFKTPAEHRLDDQNFDMEI